MVGPNTTRLFIGGLPISQDLGKGDLLKVVGAYAKDVEIIKDAEGYCKGFAYINVPHSSASTCIDKLHGAPFQKGLLRVERAQESFMDKLRKEWGDAALEKQYTFPLPSTSLALDTSSKPGKAKNGKPTPAKNGKVTPAKNGKPAQPTNGHTTNGESLVLDTSSKPGQSIIFDTSSKPGEAPNDKPLTRRAQKALEKRAKGKAKREAREANKKRKAEELEAPVPVEAAPGIESPKTETPTPKKGAKKQPTPKTGAKKEQPTPKTGAKKETPTPKTAAPKKETPNSNNKKLALNLGDDDEPANPQEAVVAEIQEKVEEKKGPAKKKQKKNTPASTPSTLPPSAPSAPSSLPTPSTPTPATPTTSYPTTPSTNTPAPSNSGVTAWDMAQVQTWAAGVAGDELAEKLKAKGVKGRKLINWKDSFSSNPNGLRKQITDFLQLPEHMEADADDLSVAILQLK